MDTTNETAAMQPENVMDTSGIGGHPRGLTTLFFTEMWERFGFYGMRAVLDLFMTVPLLEGGLGYNTQTASSVYHGFNGAVYMTPLIGGWLADRYFGARRAVLYGGTFLACGYYSLALPDGKLFFPGLALIAIGTGLLKANISTLVGALYQENDPRRDSGFSLFYMGINIGAFLSPLVCGFLGESCSFKSILQSMGFSPEHSWNWGFGAAGIGMTLGLVQYIANRERLKNVGSKPKRPSIIKHSATAMESAKSLGENLSPALKIQLTREEIRRLGVICVLFIFSSLFWMAYEQAGSSLNLFARDLTERRLFGIDIPASWFQSVNPIFIIVLAPVFSWVWLRLGKRDPSSPTNFSMGLLFTGLGFVVVAYASSLLGGGKVSSMWLVIVYLLHTIGELCLSPVGLSTVTRLAPQRMVGFMMGVWFLSIATGNAAAGWVAGNFEPNQGALVPLFGYVAIGTISGAIILAFITPYLKKMIGKTA